MKINEKSIIKAGVLYTAMAKTLESWNIADREIREEFENQMGTLIIGVTSNKSFQKKIGTSEAFKTKKKLGKTKAQSNKAGKEFKIITEAIYPKGTIANKIYKMIDKDEINNIEEFVNALLRYAARIWITQEEKYEISDYIKQNKSRAKHALTDMGFDFVNIDSGNEVETERFLPSL